jgi:succinyl-CoA synthetase beta subunit
MIQHKVIETYFSQFNIHVPNGFVVDSPEAAFDVVYNIGEF